MVTLNQQQNAPEFVHSIDDTGSICYVNDAWLNFATENGWPISADEIIGSQLVSSIMGPETRHIYDLLINRAREEGLQAQFKYHCDSPDRRRLMEMRIFHDQVSDQVEFRSRIISTEKRKPIVLIDSLYENRSDTILKMCSWCKAIWYEHNWVELERAVQQLGFMTEQELPQISHGICSQCSKQMTKVIDN